jgi:mono/diheme cytochrome c family protein
MRTVSVISGASVVAVLLCLLQGCSRDDSAGDRDATAADPGAPAPAATPASPSESSGAASTTETAPTGSGETPAAVAAGGAAAGDVGAKTFQTYCQTCHGPAGKGDGPAAAGLNPKPASFADGQFKFDPNGNGTKGELDDIKAVVRDGAAKYGGSPLMAPWPSLAPEQLQGVAEHVKSLAGAQ